MDYSRQFVRQAKVAYNEAQSRGDWIGVVEAARYGGEAMDGKKDSDATKNLPEGEPTQVLPKGTKTRLPKRRSVFAALDKIAKSGRRRT